MADTRRQCVDAMMVRTQIVYGGDEGLTRVRNLYERLYDEDDITAGILKYLCKEPRFKAMVDCDSNNIRRMKWKFVDLDGSEESGISRTSLADFSTNTVYLGAMVDRHWKEETVAGFFADVLAQMSLHLAFSNGGKPYERGDGVHERNFKRALEEAEEKKKRGEVLDGWMQYALNEDTQSAKEIYLAAVVPSNIAEYGSTEATSRLRVQVPLLFDYFKEHVAATLLAKARE